MVGDRVNIHDSVFDICHRLGLVPEDVARLDIMPRSVTATVYRLSKNGAKFIEEVPEMLPSDEPDSDATGFTTRPATETKTFEVATWAEERRRRWWQR